jgi:hypothetical protein
MRSRLTPVFAHSGPYTQPRNQAGDLLSDLQVSRNQIGTLIDPILRQDRHTDTSINRGGPISVNRDASTVQAADRQRANNGAAKGRPNTPQIMKKFVKRGEGAKKK